MKDRERRTTQPAPDVYSEEHSGERWRAVFPYHWDADDLVSRRQLLQLAVSTSGALFAGAAGLALLGWLQRPLRGQRVAISRVSDVREGQAFYFHYPTPDDEAVLLRLPGGRFVAYGQKCTHLACSVYYQPAAGHLHCPCHEGVFDPQTGQPIAGPPQRPLRQIELLQEGDMIYAVDLVV